MGSSNGTWQGDVLVVGGGPAGSVLARLLAGRGHAVALVHGAGTSSGVAAETTIAGADALLARLELDGLFRELGFGARGQHGTIWETPELSRRAADGQRVDRSRLDPALRQRAREAGVHLIESARVAGPLAPDRDLELRGADGRVRARVVVAATGRDTARDLVPTTERAVGPATLSLTTDPLAAGDAIDPVIEAVPQGWWWWVPRADGVATLSLLADRDEVREVGRDALWDAARAAARGPAASSDARPTRGVDAGARLRETAGPEPVLLCGDAALTLDPLTSQGLERALASALHTAQAVGALLEGREDPADVRAARRTFERDLAEVHADGCARAYARVERFRDAPFWARRRVPPAPTSPRRDAPPGPDVLLAPSPELIPARALRAKGELLVGADGWAHPDDPAALARVGPFAVEALLEVLRARPLEPSEAALAASRAPGLMGASPAELAAAFAFLWRRGYLTDARSTSS